MRGPGSRGIAGFPAGFGDRATVRDLVGTSVDTGLGRRVATTFGGARLLRAAAALVAFGTLGAFAPAAEAAAPQWPFVVFRPANLSKAQPVPLVVLPTGSISDTRSRTNIEAAANQRGFVVAYAQINKSYNDVVHAAGSEDPAHPYPDMVDIANVIDSVIASENIDPARVFMTGFSLGATLTYRAGCILSGKLAAIAPVAGVVVNPNCHATRPVSLYAFNGTSDPGAPYNGGGGFPSVATEIDLWKGYDGCTGSSSNTVSGPVTIATWNQCSAGSVVQLATIQGAGHSWPTGGRLDATTALTAFFLSLPRATAKPTLAAKVLSVSFKKGKPRSIVVRLSSNAPAAVRATMVARGRTFVSRSLAAPAGVSALRLRLPSSLQRGSYVLALKLKTSLGSTTIRRAVRVPR